MATITYLTKIQFDFGARALLAEELSGLGVQRPLLVTDPGIVAAGLVDMIRDLLPRDMAVAVFDRTPENPTEAAAKQALAVYREARCDGLIGLGGGSSLDLAKAVGILVHHPEPLVQYAFVEGGLPKIRGQLPPVVAIPTTAGTGSEVGRGAIVVMADGRKLGLVSPRLIPSVAICDPELTLGLPPRLTAATGLDAIAHCVETFISPVVNPPAGAIALDGLGRAIRHIETATRDGSDREARWNMMMASMEGAMAFQKGLGAVHAMSHPLGAIDHLTLHHGTLNAVVMPTVLRFNAGHVGDKYDRLADVMGLASGSQVIDAIAGLNQRLGIPAGLREMGVEDAWLADLSKQAVQDHTNATNPRPAAAEDYLALFREAMG